MQDAPGIGNSSKAIWILLAGGLLLGLGLGVVLFGFNAASPTTASAPGSSAELAPLVTLGGPAPNFTLVDARSGTAVELDALRGQPVMINFWATWCGPCEVEMPDIEAAYQTYADAGLVVLAINAGESRNDVLNFGDRLDLSFNLLLDSDNAVQDIYRIRAFPSTFFLDGEGTVKAVQIGYMSAEQLDEHLAQILP